MPREVISPITLTTSVFKSFVSAATLPATAARSAVLARAVSSAVACASVSGTANIPLASLRIKPSERATGKAEGTYFVPQVGAGVWIEFEQVPTLALAPPPIPPVLGRAPAAEWFTPTYRIGNGPEGNIGAASLAHIVLPTSPGGRSRSPRSTQRPRST